MHSIDYYLQFGTSHVNLRYFYLFVPYSESETFIFVFEFSLPTRVIFKS